MRFADALALEAKMDDDTANHGSSAWRSGAPKWYLRRQRAKLISRDAAAQARARKATAKRKRGGLG
jgi:hypothetical protein